MGNIILEMLETENVGNAILDIILGILLDIFLSVCK
jgi:hypothetical protein